MSENPAPDRHARLLLACVVALSAAGMALMAALGLYAFVWKTAVIPVILLAVLVTRRLGRFVDDWAVFLGAVILFDFLRGLVFSIVSRFGLPVYMGYAIDWERRVAGGNVLPVLLQEWRSAVAAGPALDRALTMFHGSHFVFFLVFGMAVWLLRAEEFHRYKTAVVMLLYVGLVLYVIFPTVPPWMASDYFGVIPPVEHVSLEIYNVEIPSLQKAFDVNPIAAMPSLHAALPTLCALIGVRHFGLRALPLVAYTAVIWLAVVYLGEHYLVDVLAGAALAAAVYLLVYRFDLAPAPGRRRLAVSPVLLSALLITMAEGIGQATSLLARPWGVTRDFAARELTRPEVRQYVRGRSAFDAGRYDDAARDFEAAFAGYGEPGQRRRAAEWMARSAYHSGSYASAVRALEAVRDGAGPSALVMLAVGYLHDDREAEGLALLHQLVERYPRDPEPLYWMTRVHYERQRASRADVLKVVERMQEFPDPKRTASFQRLLMRTIDGQS